MPASADAIVSTATDEWTHWGKCTWNCITGKKSKGHNTDDENKFAKYVIDKYCTAVLKAPIEYPTIPAISEDQYAWSAVTISYIMLKAGFTKKEFPVSEAHAKYIVWSIKARKNKDKTAAYWGYRVDEAQAKPEVGDLIGYARSKKALTSAKVLAYFDRTGSYESHTDIVVAKRAGEIDVIGGNVRDSVTKKTLAIDSNGLLADTSFYWFVVMKKRT